jgi:hypothetical protein
MLSVDTGAPLSADDPEGERAQIAHRRVFCHQSSLAAPIELEIGRKIGCFRSLLEAGGQIEFSSCADRRSEMKTSLRAGIPEGI